MTSYEPNPVVTFADVNVYSDHTIANIQINMGRGDVLDQPQPGYARIVLWTDANEPLNVNLSDSVNIALESSKYGEPTRTNLIPNPSFEINTTGWLASSGSLARVTTDALYGTASAQITFTNPTAGQGLSNNTGSNRMPITGGQTYTASAYIKVPAGNPAVTLDADIFYWDAVGAGGNVVNSIDGSNFTISSTDGWVRISATGTAAANATHATVRFGYGINQTGTFVYLLDGALLEQSSTLGDYFDGSTTIPLGAAWTGTPNASTSTLTGVLAPIFTGIVSDIDISLAQFGEVGSIAEYTLTAVGPLAQLNKRTAGAAGYAKEFDGTRILNILTDAFLTAWDDVGTTLTWNQLPNDVTWASYDGVNETLVNNLATTIDVPGQFELMAYSDGPTNAYTLADIAAQSGRGVLYEAGNGHLHYGDYASRAGQTPLTLTADDLLTDGLSTAAQWSEIVNDAEITYRAGSEYARDEQSVILYGQLSGSRSTVLHNASDALQQAEDFISSRAYPRVYPNNLTVALHNPNVTDATRDELIIAENGREIITSSLPAVFGTNFNGFIEGYQWNLTRYEAVLTLICSAVSETYPHVIWYQIPPTQDWATYNATTKWSDL